MSQENRTNPERRQAARRLAVEARADAINPSAATSLVDILEQRARLTPHQAAYAFVQENGEMQYLTYQGIYLQAAGFAAMLQAEGLEGERVLLVFKSNPYFIIAFFACLMAGAIAVPTSPPRRQYLAERLQLLAKNAGARAALLDSDEIMQAALTFGDGDLQWFDVRELARTESLLKRAAEWHKPVLGGERLAFLQYTSGTTGDPKGVMVSHGNLMANSAIIREAFGHTPNSVGLVGLPLYHDMGLVGGVLQPLYAGFLMYLMTPVQLVQNPLRWLDLISKYRVTTSGGPNFMYELAVRAAREDVPEDLDLSSWRVAFCGAERIRAAAVRSFAAIFGARGFRSAAFYPCYGMAEATLFISGLAEGAHWHAEPSANNGKPESVCCGRAFHDTVVRIVEPESRRACDEGEEGEIWVAGASVAKGYWKRPELSQAIFGGHIDGSDAGPFLRTGDLGFMRQGELFVTGRIKDLVIVHGRNYAPQDLEQTAEAAHPGIVTAACVAFGLQDDAGERLVLAFELRRDFLRREEIINAVCSSVRSAVSTAWQLRVDEILVLPPGALPRTSSGKLRRAKCRDDFLAGHLGKRRSGESVPA